MLWEVSKHCCCLVSIAHHCCFFKEGKKSHWKLNIYTPTYTNPSRSKGGKLILKNIPNYFPILKGIIRQLARNLYISYHIFPNKE